MVYNNIIYYVKKMISDNLSNKEIYRISTDIYGKETADTFKYLLNKLGRENFVEKLFVYENETFLKYIDSDIVNLSEIYIYCKKNSKLDILKDFIKYYYKENFKKNHIMFKNYSIIDNYEILELLAKHKKYDTMFVEFLTVDTNSLLYNMYMLDSKKTLKFLDNFFKKVRSKSYKDIFFAYIYLYNNDFNNFKIYFDKLNLVLEVQLFNFILDNSRKIDIQFISFYYEYVNEVHQRYMDDAIIDRIVKNVDELLYLVNNSTIFKNNIISKKITIKPEFIKKDIDTLSIAYIIDNNIIYNYDFYEHNSLLNKFKDRYKNILKNLNDKDRFTFLKLLKNSDIIKELNIKKDIGL